MISIAGEALIDLVISPDGSVEAKLGGAPFNTARACGRLGVDVEFIGAISVDRFGSMLVDQLVKDGVDVASVARVEAPTTLAAAELDEHGAASYRFYVDGTSAPALTASTAAGSSSGALFTGGLSLMLEPMATTVESMVTGSDPDRLVMVDVNCRPLLIADRDTYVDRVERVLARADVVKVSDEDLAYLMPGAPIADAASALLALGVTAVLVTAGGDGVHVFTNEGADRVAVEPVDVVDTIGAGDSFGAGLLAWSIGNGLGRSDVARLDVLRRAVAAANAVAGVVVTRRGADPPWRSELPDDWPS